MVILLRQEELTRFQNSQRLKLKQLKPGCSLFRYLRTAIYIDRQGWTLSFFQIKEIFKVAFT